MIEPFKMFYTVLGGLGIFILGMKYLSDSLQMLSGGLIRKSTSSLTTNRILAVLFGLTNAGLMQLTQAIGVILGANIGTTITAQLAAIGGTVVSRRAAMAHSVFNVLGVVAIITIFPFFISLVESVVPGSANFVDGSGGRP
jgi:Na+/phosphate symporter